MLALLLGSQSITGIFGDRSLQFAKQNPGTGPTGRGDGNPLTESDLTFTSLGAPAVNGAGRNFTPHFQHILLDMQFLELLSLKY